MSRRLRKFKLKASTGDIEVHYEQENGSTGTWDEFTMKSFEAPVSELEVALQDMDEHVIDICELPAVMRDQLTVSGVSISYTDDIQGVVITSMRSLSGSNGPMIINTPHFSAQPYGEGSDASMSVFSLECGAALEYLETQVFKYIDGERAQMGLFVSSGEEQT